MALSLGFGRGDLHTGYIYMITLTGIDEKYEITATLINFGRVFFQHSPHTFYHQLFYISPQHFYLIRR
jgi:hypothetical protein